MLKGQFVDCLLVGVKRFSMENGAVHDRNSMPENLRRSLQDSVRGYANQCSIYFPHLTHMGQQRNVSEVVRQAVHSTGRPTDECPHPEVMAQSNEFRAGLSNSPDSDDCEMQRLPE